MRWIERVNMPKEPGFFCARTGSCEWWNLIAYVHGDSPFFKVDVWEYTNDRLIVNANVYDIEEFGPKIFDKLPAIQRTAQEWKTLYA